MLVLDKNQKTAVESDAERLVIVAGAGSGKTRVFISRIEHIIRSGYSPGRILAMTFTRMAAKEITRRLEHSELYTKGLTVGTFHSVFFRLINEFAPRLDYKRPITPYDEYFSADVLVDEMISLGLPYSNRKKNEELRGKDPRVVFNQMRRLEREDPTNARRVTEAYRKKLKRHNAVGYDDMISLAVKLLKDNKDVQQQLHNLWEWVLVDEAQDTDSTQIELLELLNPKFLTAVGDDGQAIYEWRGADPRGIIELAEHSTVIHLDTNYRSTAAIVEASNTLLKFNVNQIPRDIKPTWYADRGLIKYHWSTFEDTTYDAAVLARDIITEGKYGSGEIAILCRTNSMAGSTSWNLNSLSIPHRLIKRGEFWDMEPVRCIVASLMLLQNINNNNAWNRAINFPFVRLSPLTRAAIKKIAAQKKLRLFQATAQLISNDDLKDQDYEIIQWALNFAIVAGRYYKDKYYGQDWTAIECLDNLNKILGWLDYFKMLPSKMVAPRMIIDRIRLQMKSLGTDEKPISLNDFLEWYASRDLQDEADNELPLVTVCTIHAAKGLEWPVVILPGWTDLKYPNRQSISDGRIEEERRLAYVAITRAERECHIFGGLTPCRFVEEAGLINNDVKDDDDDFII